MFIKLVNFYLLHFPNFIFLRLKLSLATQSSNILTLLEVAIENNEIAKNNHCSRDRNFENLLNIKCLLSLKSLVKIIKTLFN